ncbi:hypothetical protein [[Eubacterium] cellulosolvens]
MLATQDEIKYVYERGYLDGSRETMQFCGRLPHELVRTVVQQSTVVQSLKS